MASIKKYHIIAKTLSLKYKLLNISMINQFLKMKKDLHKLGKEVDLLSKGKKDNYIKNNKNKNK